MAKNWTDMRAAELGNEIAAGRLNPVTLAEMQLDAIAAHPLSQRIFVRVMPNRSRAEALAADARSRQGLRRGPLDGIALVWKDNFDTVGRETEAGSALLKGRIPDQDAAVLAQATLQGTVCLGKTHMSELAFSGLGLNPVTATPHCINDENAVAGGSSSGAAAAVAHGLLPLAIGTDTGGSVRIPAAWNDLVGLKCSAARLPKSGVVPLCKQFDSIGPLARNVEDCALALGALEGRRPADLEGASLHGVRLAVLDTLMMDEIADAPAAGFADAIARLGKAGAQITRLDFPALHEAMALAPVLFAAEAYALWKDVIERAPEKMFPPILARFRAGADFSALSYIQAWEQLHLLRRAWDAATAAFDAVLVPTAPILPPNIKRLLTDPAYYAHQNLLALRNTRVANLMDLCAITLPTSQPSCGLSLMAPAFQEGRLLRLAAAAERTRAF